MKDHDVHSLSHTKWECKYHIVFAPKYRRKVFYGQKRYEIGQILRELCRWKQVNLLEAEACPDHIHILVEIPPKISVSNFMGFLKGKSSLMIYEKWGNMKYKYRNRSFWCRGYYVSTVGKNEKKITEYIQNQLKEDYMSEQLVLVVSRFFRKFISSASKYRHQMYGFSSSAGCSISILNRCSMSI